MRRSGEPVSRGTAVADDRWRVWLAILAVASAVAATTLASAQTAGYPASAAEARRARESLERDVADARAQPDRRIALTAAREDFIALLREIEGLYARTAELDGEQATRVARESAARAALARPASAKSFRGSPSPEQINLLSGVAQDTRRKLDALKARRASIEDQRDAGLRAERDRATARRDEVVARLAAFQADANKVRDQARSLEDQQAVEVRSRVLATSVEHANRWLALLARAGESLPAEIAVLDLEIEAATKAVTRADAELRSAWDAESAALGRTQKETEAAHRAAARDVASAMGDWERLLQQWRADTLSLDARSAARKRELAAVQGAGLRADAMDGAKARFDQVRERFEKSRAVGIDTVPLIRRGLERVAKDRELHLAAGQLQRWRTARADAVTALEEIENQLADLEESWRSTVAVARQAWLAASAGETATLTQLWESEELPIWEEAQRQRRESLRALDEDLRAVSDEYQARLERAAALDTMWQGEQRWLERRALLARSDPASPAQAVRQAWLDYQTWKANGGTIHWVVLGGLAVLIGCWKLMVGRVRTLTAKRGILAKEGDAEQMAARRAWRAVLVRASWVPLGPILGWLAASVIDADLEESAALAHAGWLAGGVLAVYALMRGLLTNTRDDRSVRRYRRLAAASATILMVLGLPLYYLNAIAYESCNPDLMLLLGRSVRTLLAVGIAIAVAFRVLVVALLPARMKEATRRWLDPLRFGLLAIVAVTLVVDWSGYVQLASALFNAAFGSALVISLGVFGARSALKALSYTSDTTVTDVLAEERRAFLLQQARTVVLIGTGAVVVWGIGLALRVVPGDLQMVAAKPLWPFRTEGTAGLTLGSLWAATMELVATVVVARALRGGLDHFALAWAGIERDLRYSVATVTNYVILALGIAKSIGKLGVELKDLQWLLAAAGVGIGFGLQEIISNFVSGIIILFERPLKIGDVVEVDGRPGEVVDVSIRSTTVRTQDNKFVLVPNKEIITQRLTNFTGLDPKLRIDVPIGVAYGTDTAQVRETLLDAARRHGRVFKRPPPDVLFKAHGESSLDFVLRAWVHVNDRDEVASDLRYAIETALRRQRIEVPFPQRVVHVVGGPVAGLADEPDGRDTEEEPRRPGPDPRRLA